MKIGILVNTDRSLDAVIGLTKAALSKGHDVSIFTMDDGTKLFENPAYAELCKLQGVAMSFCDHSAKGLGVKTEGLSDAVICGSHYNNAAMHHASDRVIVL